VYHYDSRGSTVALTDINGNITDRYTYDPFGCLMRSQGETYNPFKYNGRDGVMTDPNGLYYMRSRYFNPDSKRFMGRDILLGSILESQSINRYSYVVGDPINLIDPMGFSGQKDSGFNDTLDYVQAGLDVAGLIDVYGIGMIAVLTCYLRF
jgi:RHS repeat-associated protein